jgi:TolB-like protein/tetratricopeptide (TPR) repeat protein
MSSVPEFLYQFGPFNVSGRERVLLREGVPVSLAPKALDILLVLIRNSGHLVTKEQLMAEVWPATYVEEANLTQNVSILRKVLNDGVEGSSYIETVPRRGYRFLAQVQRIPEVESDAATSDAPAEKVYRLLAIMPFVNASQDDQMEYLSEGITESIISSLSHLPQLRVMSRNAVSRFKGLNVDAQRIGKELAVDAVLLGRVQLLNSRLQISTELVDVANGWQLWGENYDREVKAIFELQDEIAKQISATLRLRLTGEEEQHLTRRYTENADAYQAYLQGRYHWSTFTRQGLEQATIFFREAINLDPNYALAYAGIVDCYLRLATNYIPPPETRIRLKQTIAGFGDSSASTQKAGQKNRVRQNNTSEESSESGDGISNGITLTQTGIVTSLTQSLVIPPRLPVYEASSAANGLEEIQEPVRTRYRWDWTGVERELKRANELKSTYPATHQWHAAYIYSLNLYDESLVSEARREKYGSSVGSELQQKSMPLGNRFFSPTPTADEEAQIVCTIARDQIEVGNYEGACRILRTHWTIGEWPQLEGLNSFTAGDLLFTSGSLMGRVARSNELGSGQKLAEALLSGAIGIFENLGLKKRSAEARIELSYSYYAEGLFDLARLTVLTAFRLLTVGDVELRSLALLRLGIIERHSGRLNEALARLNEAGKLAGMVGPWITGRYHLEMATTLKNLAVSEMNDEFFQMALEHHQTALCQLEAIGNHRYVGKVENNQGYLLLILGHHEAAQQHLVRARSLLASLGDDMSRAQVDETLSRLYLARGDFVAANESVSKAIEVMETADGEAVLAEALTTRGVVLCRLGRMSEAKRELDRAGQLAERCGYVDGMARAFSAIIDEMAEDLLEYERTELGVRIERLIRAQHPSPMLNRLNECLTKLRSSGLTK